MSYLRQFFDLLFAPLRAMLSSAVEDELVRENVALRLPRIGRPPPGERTKKPAARLLAAGD